jgi:hypothetical protein
VTAPLGGAPQEVRQAYLEATVGGQPVTEVAAGNQARRLALGLLGAAGACALVDVEQAGSTALRVVAAAHVAAFVIAAAVLRLGRGAVGVGLGTAVGFMVFGADFGLLSLHATDRFDLLILASAMLGLAGGIAAARDRTPSVRSGVPLGWSLTAVVAGFGTVTAADLPWYHTGGPGPSVDCCPILEQSGWSMVAAFARLFVLAILLVWVAGTGRTTRSTGGYLGIALAGLAGMAGPVYTALTTPDVSPDLGIWIGAAAFLLPLLYGLGGLRRSLPPPTVVAPTRAWRPPADRQASR